LHSLQVIDPEGGKRFQPGGRIKGCYHAIGKPEGVLIVCEGYATGASIHEATGYAVAVAFNAGNLESVALALHQKYPALQLIMAADDDWKTPGNPGMTKATQAARAVGGRVAVPTFPADRPVKATDFNDLHQLAGLDAVRACMDGVQPETTETFPALPEGVDPVGDQWPEPLPLIDSITPEPYPLDALPTAMREAVLEVQGFAQAPMAMVATSALSALSMAAQALHDVKRAEKLTGPIGLFTLVLADSGERKTTCDDFFMPAIRQWQRGQEETMRPQVESHEAAMGAWNAEREGVVAKIKELSKNGRPTDALKRDLVDLQAEKPEPPRVPRLIYSDITPEELGYQLAKRWPSAAITASEGGIVLGGHSMTGDSAMRNMARLNDLWSGQEISSDRRTSESWVARGARLTVGLQVQESTLRSFFDKSAGLARGTGFLARFLVAWPQSTQGKRLFKDAPGQWPKLAAYHQRIERILSVPTPMDDGGALTPSLIPLSAEAKAMWVLYHDEVEIQLAAGGDYADVRDVASKSADNAARLAALFHIFEYGGGGAIGLEAMEAGCMVASWHLQESRRFFGEIAVPVEVADAMRVIRWAVEVGRTQGGTVATRDLQRLGPVRSKDRLDTALRELQTHHHVRQRTEGKRKLLEINPALLEATAP
jgi:putative DNA primase/helicase